MKKRVISAIVALIIVIPLIILGGNPYYIGCSILGIIGFYELTNLKNNEKEIPFIIKCLSLLSFIFIMLFDVDGILFKIDERIISVAVLANIIPIIFYGKSKKYDSRDAFFIICSILFLGIAFKNLIVIRNISINYLLYILIITTMTDTFAHFFGTKIGKHKLCPYVSPNKTIEGMIGGTLFGTFLGYMFYSTFIGGELSVLLIITYSLIISLVAQFGDLVFSTIKREYNVKDYGNIMPGHGGVLDRLDSILLASYVFIILFMF